MAEVVYVPNAAERCNSALRLSEKEGEWEIAEISRWLFRR